MNTSDYCFLNSVRYSSNFFGVASTYQGHPRLNLSQPWKRTTATPQHMWCTIISLSWVFSWLSLSYFFLAAPPKKSTQGNLSRTLPFLKKNEEKRYVPHSTPTTCCRLGCFTYFAKAWLVFFFVLLDASKSWALGIENLSTFVFLMFGVGACLEVKG